jgi:acetyl/propionyl-CoA carboxylase alpha subunit
MMAAPLKKLLIANRGEIAIRIARTAAEMNLHTVAVYSQDDSQSLHTRCADESRALTGIGPAAYLAAHQLVAIGRETNCDAIHPGYGFLSENSAFARLCVDAGITFVGPSVETLALFGDKAAARQFAAANGVPVLRGTAGPTRLEEAWEFLATLGTGAGLMVKAIAGGGGRGMRPVTHADELALAFESCRAEALNAFGNGDLYVEELFPKARHIEVQIVGDGTGAVTHLWERDCSLQRNRQKLIEIAPAPYLRPAIRSRLLDAAVKLAAACDYQGVGTFEFLVDARSDSDDAAIAFIEANARLQVEHTVTEQVIGIDLVRTQLEIAGGSTLAMLNLRVGDIPPPRGIAIEARINLETMQADGSIRPSGGVLTAYDPPAGPGVRVDGYGYAGYRINPRFDSLLAKVIVHVGTGRLPEAIGKARRTLAEFRIAGSDSNIPLLQSLLCHPDLQTSRIDTNFVEEHAGALTAVEGHVKARYFDATAPAPLDQDGADQPDAPEGTVPLRAPNAGLIVSVSVEQGDEVTSGQQIMLIEAMKMQFPVTATASGIIQTILVAAGETVRSGWTVALLAEHAAGAAHRRTEQEIDLDLIRPDLAEMFARRARGSDAARVNATARRRAKGQRTARENIDDLCDPDSFLEYGSLAVAARRRTVDIETLIDQTQADGLIMGLAQINRHLFPEDHSRAIVLAYDYTVMAGTQGVIGLRKQQRMFELAAKQRLPVVLFAEGGGGRGGDTDNISNITDAWHRMAALSGLVPLVGIVAGHCFAGNAVMLGCCDVIIATENATIGMAGPALIEAGGLGRFLPEEVGPMKVQVPNGVVDIAVRDEAEAVQAARKYLSYFQGRLADWTCDDQRKLRHVVPQDRLRAYDMRHLIDVLADTGSVLELRAGFGQSMITAFIRIEGRPMGVIANNPMHLAGAIDSDAADKAARFMQLCDAYDIPLLSLNDNPGNMVGPEAEKTASVRHCCRTLLVGASLTIPTFFVIIRKAYGLGKLAMTGGSMQLGVFAIAWPTGEFGHMGLEGQVRLSRAKELAAIADPDERLAAFNQMVAELYEHGKALNAGSLYEFDEVIDPADTRKWLVAGLRVAPPVSPRTGKKRPCIDGW